MTGTDRVDESEEKGGRVQGDAIRIGATLAHLRAEISALTSGQRWTAAACVAGLVLFLGAGLPSDRVFDDNRVTGSLGVSAPAATTTMAPAAGAEPPGGAPASPGVPVVAPSRPPTADPPAATTPTTQPDAAGPTPAPSQPEDPEEPDPPCPLPEEDPVGALVCTFGDGLGAGPVGPGLPLP